MTDDERTDRTRKKINMRKTMAVMVRNKADIASGGHWDCCSAEIVKHYWALLGTTGASLQVKGSNKGFVCSWKYTLKPK